MSTINTASGFRRTLSGVSLLIAPVLFAASELLTPKQVTNAAEQLDVYAAHRSALLASSLLSIAVALTLLAGTIGIVHLVRARGVTYANLAAVLIGYGLITAHAGLGAIGLVFAEMVRPGLDRTAMTQLYDKITHDAPVGGPLLLGHYLLVVGIILLAVALLRAHVGSRWAAICLLLYPISDVVLSGAPVGDLADLVSNALGVVSLGAYGLHLLRMRDDEWDTVTAATAARTSLATTSVAATA
ncbi:MAG: hypothetical protein WCD35_13135 [Mycobacteriales bacterium]